MALMTGLSPTCRHDSGLHVRAESRQARFQHVRPDRQVRQHVGPGFICHRVPCDAGVGLRRGDFHSRQYRSALVPDRAADLGGRLRPNRSAHQDVKQHSYKHTDPEAWDEALHVSAQHLALLKGRDYLLWFKVTATLA